MIFTLDLGRLGRFEFSVWRESWFMASWALVFVKLEFWYRDVFRFEVYRPLERLPEGKVGWGSLAVSLGFGSWRRNWGIVGGGEL